MQLEMLPCITKSTTGMECPGCGFQRAVKLLFEGQIWESVLMYPALIPLIALALFTVMHLKFRFSFGAKMIIWMFSIAAFIIAANYITYIYQLMKL